MNIIKHRCQYLTILKLKYSYISASMFYSFFPAVYSKYWNITRCIYSDLDFYLIK